MESVLNVTVTTFTHYDDKQPVHMNLLEYLADETHRPLVDEIRQEQDLEKRAILKKRMPGSTPSVTCSQRNEASILEHSGLLAFDIDFKDNKHITNFAHLKQQICNIKSVAYCGLSVSGAGFWGLVPIEHKDKHKQHFKALQQAFLKFGIIIDSAPSNPVSFRFYSYDVDAYFNHNAHPLKVYYTPPAYVPKPYSYSADKDELKVRACLEEIERTGTDITKYLSQPEWAAIGYSLAAAFGESGRDYFHRASQYHPTYSPKETDNVYRSCLSKKQGNIGTFFKRCKEAEIKYVDSPLFSEKQDTPPPKPYKPDSPIEPLPEEIPHHYAPARELPQEVEFYNQTFQELCENLGYERALDKAEYYLGLSCKHNDCPTYYIHTCTLLSTYKQAKAA